MDSYQRLLVVVDEHDFSLKGIARALYMASRTTNASIIVMLLEHGSFVSRLVDTFEHGNEADTGEGLNGHSTQMSLDKKRHCITQFIQTNRQNGLSISQASISCHSCDDVLSFCEDFKVDTIFIAASRHKLWNWLTIKALDTRLVRESPRPVVVVKDHLWEPGGRILSLVDPCNNGEDEQALNKKVLQTAEHFTRLLKGYCHLLDCYYGETPSISFHQSVSPEGDEQYHFERLSRYSSEYHLLPDRSLKAREYCHLVKELPEDAIESLSKKVDSELVIIGDKGTSSFFSNLCGHAADQVIDRINCDLLVVKPQ
ncbi:hypothetical protein LZP69_05200 [Shewanella sp. AS1]|uniref:hypothetical protein n=1 Tax=Shewanella sp. AS1 TaxID=2907626 RepID=UPI001F23C870|nr:hypothetical protein [Shewanella sp. AS1]MCE9678588.1 hypothetical protein [Shewanella sp. AS1]